MQWHKIEKWAKVLYEKIGISIGQFGGRNFTSIRKGCHSNNSKYAECTVSYKNS